MNKTLFIAIITSALLCAVVPTSAQHAPDTEVFKSLLKTINFEYNSAKLTPSSYTALDSIAALFMRNAKLRYEIQGHSDSIGSAKYNELLSGARAEAVKSYIISKGVHEANIIAIGYGSEKPIAGNETDKGRAANRRVEILLIESQEKYEELKESETKQQEDIRKAGIVVAEAEVSEPVPEPKPEPEIAPACECEKHKEPESKPEEPVLIPQQKQKSKISFGLGGFFSNDFGGGFNIPKINIGNVKIPETEVKTPWISGGIKGFLDITYAEFGVGLAFGGGTMEMAATKIGWSFTALNLSLLGKYPIELADNISLFPAAGIDYQQILSMKVGEEDIADVGDNDVLWFKLGAGMDIALSDAIFIRPMLLYGIRQANKWESNSVKPLTADGKEGATLLGHGFTFSVGIGFKL